MMNLPIKSKKGLFPHGLNTYLNLAKKYPLKRGLFPPRKFFYTKRMSSEEYNHFCRWHRKNTVSYANKQLRYNLRAKLKDYCCQDVEILRQGCEMIRHWFQNLTGIDCLVEKQTLSSACFAHYRKSYMGKNTIPNISPLGLQPESISSIVAEAYILYLEAKNKLRIQSALTGREKREGIYR